MSKRKPPGARDIPSDQAARRRKVWEMRHCRFCHKEFHPGVKLAHERACNSNPANRQEQAPPPDKELI